MISEVFASTLPISLHACGCSVIGADHAWISRSKSTSFGLTLPIYIF